MAGRLTREQLDQCLSTNGQVLADARPMFRRYCLKQEIRTSAFGWIVLDNEATDGEALIIRAQIAWLSAEMLQDIQARLAAGARRKVLVSKIKETIQNNLVKKRYRWYQEQIQKQTLTYDEWIREGEAREDEHCAQSTGQSTRR